MKFPNFRKLRPLLFFLLGLSAFFFLNSTTNYYLEAQEIETSPTQSESLSKRAASSYWQGQYQDAISIWENLLKSASSEEAATIYRYCGVAYRQVGQLGRALESLKQASQFYEQSNDETTRARLAEVLVERAQIHNEMGQSSRSVSLVEQALKLIEQSKLVLLQTSAYQALGTAYLLGGDFDRAIEAYQQSRNLAAVLEQPEELVSALNNLTNTLLQRQARYRSDAEMAGAEGNETEAQRLVFLAERDSEAALSAALKAIKESQRMENLSAVRARLNMAELSPETGYRWQARAILDRLPPSREKANLLLNLAQLEAGQESIPLLEEAASMAASLGDWRTQSFALGQLGYIYEKSGNYGQALEYTQQAQWAAQQVMAADSLYRWQWQAGRIYQATSQVEPAKSAYRGAIATLQKLREEIASASPEFQIDVREEVEPVYREFLGLLLNESRSGQIKEALEIRTQLQLSELQSFFGDACLELKQSLAQAQNVLPEGTARIHSIILEDSTYTVLELPNREFHSYRVNLQASELTEEIERWRMQLVSSSIPLSYRDLSERLYDWLIRPMKSDLAEIDTLIFVNDGLLRNVPMAALHDGKQFLVEKYALSLSLGLNLSFPPQSSGDYKSSIFGLSVSVGNFPPLPYVATETQQVKETLGGERFLNEAFTVANLQAQVRKNYPVIHLATHGEFGGTAKSTFIQTFENPLFLAQLEQILSQRREPIELLTLSACDTAAGNERAILGLAGVGLRSGTKNVLASLWSVRDDRAGALISVFYKFWQQGQSKAEALQKAQRELIANNVHPKQWASFVLIGN